MYKKTEIIAFNTILRKELVRVFRIWPQTILPSPMTMMLYFAIFGKLIGAKIGAVEGYTYMQFIVPGLIMLAVVNNSYSNVSSSFFSAARFQRNIEELLVSPTPVSLIIWGYVLAGVIRGLVVAAIVLAIAYCFTDLHIYSISLTFLVIFLTATLFSLAGLLNGVFARNFDEITIVPTFVLTPLTYLGGIFYSTSMLPEFWQNVALLNPLTHMVNAFRYGMLGVSDVNEMHAILAVLTFTVAIYCLVYYLLYKGIRIKS